MNRSFKQKLLLMRSIQFYKFVFVLSVVAMQFSISKTYYVAVNGDNKNPGTFTQPWKTISKAASMLNAGDTVLIHGGIYRESIVSARSGTPSSFITYKNYPNEEVIVEGCEEISGWIQDSGNRYRATINFTPSPQFVFGGFTTQGNKGGGLVLQNGAKMNYLMSLNKDAVDLPGEYYMNDTSRGGPPYTIYVNVRDLGKGVDPNNYKMMIGRYRKGFDLDNGADYIIVDGISFRYFNDNAIHSIGSHHCQFKNLKLYSNYITGIYLTSSSDNCVIQRCEFWDNGHGGIESASSDSVRISGNRFRRIDMGNGLGGNGCHIWIGPLSYYCTGTIIENNIAFASGSDYVNSGFVVIRGDNNIVRNNTSTDFDLGRTGGMGGGITLLIGKNNIVVNNIVYTVWGASPIAVFPDAVIGGGHFIQYNNFYCDDPANKFWWNGIKYTSLREWETWSGQSHNLFVNPDFIEIKQNDLHLKRTSACIDSGTVFNASFIDYDGNIRPQGKGYDIGAYEYSQSTHVENYNLRSQVSDFVLSQNYPNPFTQMTIKLPLLLGEGRGEVLLKIYDVFGREVLDLSNKIDNSSLTILNSQLPNPGIYFYQLRTGKEIQTRKMILIR